MEPLSCCEPAHGEPPDCNSDGDDIHSGVEIVHTQEKTHYDRTRQRCQGNDRVAKSSCSERAVPMNRSGRRPPRPRDEREERDTEDGAVDRRGQPRSNNHGWEKRDHGQPGRSAVPLFVFHRRPSLPVQIADRQVWRVSGD